MTTSAKTRLHLVLGGARSGKSRHAEAITLAAAATPVCLATARAGDDEMAARIARHRQRRGAAWEVIEEPLDLPGALRRASRPHTAVLVDCLTLWLSNLMMAKRDLEVASTGLLAALDDCTGLVVLVSGEVGQGVVPMNAMARAFVDAAGLLHQRLAARADVVELVVAGLPLRLKPGNLELGSP